MLKVSGSRPTGYSSHSSLNFDKVRTTKVTFHYYDPVIGNKTNSALWVFVPELLYIYKVFNKLINLLIKYHCLASSLQYNVYNLSEGSQFG